ncbi:MAG: class I SAM-dependent methyltransferase [Anaerovoracaceae bacterium]|jgi:SAM-dependent methyltransferase
MKDILNQIFREDDPVKIICSNPRRKTLPYRKVLFRSILLKGEKHYQAEYHYEKKVTHRNLLPEDAVSLILTLLAENFKQLDIFTPREDIQILAAKVDNPRIKRTPACRGGEDLSHNREKQYIIPQGKPCDFLIRLGVMNGDGKVYRKHYSKFRQINRFLEILSDVFPHLPQGRIRIIDFGCGKAYLTFAIYHYLVIMQKREVEIIGLDLKEDVIDFCNRVARDLDYRGLVFRQGDIADYQGESAHMVVTLHACDTATDYALINAVKWNAKVILSIPCCQHELFKQIRNKTLSPILKHGILKDRFTEILTDGLRALKLESIGYDVSMLEFISLEHTQKNVMIKAIAGRSKDSPKSKKAAEEYAALLSAYHVEPTIDRLV